MTKTAGHDKQMKNFVGAEVFVTVVKELKFQRINDAADGIHQSAGQKPCKRGAGQFGKQLGQRQYAKPSHADIKHGGNPLRTVDPEDFKNDACGCQRPNECQ